LNVKSANFYIHHKDTHLGLQFTADPQLNCCFISVLCFQERIKRMLVSPLRFLRRSDSSLESKLFFNGCWRKVASTVKKFVWSVIVEHTLASVLRGRQQEEYLFRVLAWMPEKIEIRHLPDGIAIFEFMKHEFDTGRVLAGLAVNNIVQATILAFEVVDQRRYVAVRLGSP